MSTPRYCARCGWAIGSPPPGNCPNCGWTVRRPTQAGLPVLRITWPGGSRSWNLDRSVLRLGRESDSDIEVPAPFVSRHHAIIRQDAAGDWWIEDTGSLNGLMAHGRRVTRAQLTPGTVVTIPGAGMSVDIECIPGTAAVPSVSANEVPAGTEARRQLGRGTPRPPRWNRQGRPIRALRTLAWLAILVLALGTLASAVTYVAVARELPDPATLRGQLATFRSTLILDRNGTPLAEAYNPDLGRRTVVPLDQIALDLRNATIAVEDANFYSHLGVDPIAIARAIWYAMSEGKVTSGASTIPQQLVKIAFLSPERSLQRKLKEAILAAEISRQYTKDEILELYLNEVCYGNGAYGIQAAARSYFGKDAADLTLSESALLAGLPQAPAMHDPRANPLSARARQAKVLELMAKTGYITPAAEQAARTEPIAYRQTVGSQLAPHFVYIVREAVEQRLGPEALYRTGLEVTTTLDLHLQQVAEQAVRTHVDTLAGRNVSNGALVAMSPNTGEVVALVGSKDFNNEAIAGQVNMALAPRQPGSTLKPLVYLTAFNSPTTRWTPGTLVEDIDTVFEDGVHQPYRPTNYDGKEHGLVTVRTALANSYNIPAVSTLEDTGTPEFLRVARGAGLKMLDRDDYGLSLALGSAEVPLLDLTTAYTALASQGRAIAPITILQIADDGGRVLCKHATDTPCQDTPSGQAYDPVDAFLITDILSDDEARWPAFGRNSALKLDRPAAAKTGTTNDYRDNLTVGYTPQLVAGVWVGNADNTAMHDVTGITGAAPIWREFMTAALKETAAVPFAPPPGVSQHTVCTETGTEPSAACPETRSAWFADDRPPLTAEHDLYQTIRIDTRNELLAGPHTPEEVVDARTFRVYPDKHRAWAEAHGIPQPPTEVSPTDPPRAEIMGPSAGDVISGTVSILGTASGDGFASYVLEISSDSDPDSFESIVPEPETEPVFDDVLGIWDTTDLSPGSYRLRLVVQLEDGQVGEDLITVEVESVVRQVSPTPTTIGLTATPDPTLTPTATPDAPAGSTSTPEPFWKRFWPGR